tara:strand:- start:40 stop:450 length:411 start_codon:yes stop_codon:yes gene_type:complete
MKKKYHTEEERKEARRIWSAKWRAKNKDNLSKYQKEYKDKNRDLVSKKAREYNNSKFYVYTHTNSKGDLYIGSGNKSRSIDFHSSTRSKYWIEAFKEKCIVEIIREFNTKEEALSLEFNMIRAIGLNNLINKKQAK